jgi:hypothetical protein
MAVLLVFEEYFEELMEAWGFFAPGIDFKYVWGNAALFWGSAC